MLVRPKAEPLARSQSSGGFDGRPTPSSNKRKNPPVTMADELTLKAVDGWATSDWPSRVV